MMKYLRKICLKLFKKGLISFLNNVLQLFRVLLLNIIQKQADQEIFLSVAMPFTALTYKAMVVLRVVFNANSGTLDA